jgi:hypothetical protein
VRVSVHHQDAQNSVFRLRCPAGNLATRSVMPSGWFSPFRKLYRISITLSASRITRFAGEPGGGLIVPPDTSLGFHHKLIVDLAQRNRLPAIYPFRYYAAAGGLVSRWRTGAPSRSMESDSHSAPPHDVTRKYVADSFTRSCGPASTSRATRISDCAQYRC